MKQALCIAVRFHDGRYHGAGDWPPAPARLFQALLAGGAAQGLDDDKRRALEWLETLAAPTIAAPAAHSGQNVNLFLPNNDLDAKGGDIRRIAEIRSATKRTRPRLFDAAVPLLYVWRFDGDESHAKRICDIADGLYQFGRGVDMAWAVGDLVDEAKAEEQLCNYPGPIYRPSQGGKGVVLNGPDAGSLQSLSERHAASTQRFTRFNGKTQFANAPRPRFRAVTYNSPAARLVFDLRRTTSTGAPFATWPLAGAAMLANALRDGACVRLNQHFSGSGVVDKVLVGRSATEADKAQRIQIVPLPSIGHLHADRNIRRVLVIVPPDCPIRAADVAWGFAGLEITAPVLDVETGEILASPVELVKADDDAMLVHYGTAEEHAARVWRSVTPLALPEPTAHVVLQALRHAGVREGLTGLRIQREPFEARGERAETFAAGTRFSAHQLWHVEVELTSCVAGPLLLGNGRYVGLGLMAPVPRLDDLLVFDVADGLIHHADPVELARSLRRAVMARVRNILGLAADAGLDRYFSGHERDGAKAAANVGRHLAYHWDAPRQRLLLIAPHRLEQRAAYADEQEKLATLASALGGFRQLSAGAAGCMALRQSFPSLADPLLVSARCWESVTPFSVTRHRRCASAEHALVVDVVSECERIGLPRPEVSVLDVRAMPGRGLQGRLRLEFSVPVTGPVALGRSSLLGGGLFAASPQR